MAASHQNTYTMDVGVATLRQIINNSKFCSTLNLTFKSENPLPNGVWYRFHHGTTFTSWGEKITIRIEEISTAKTFMSIHSECGMPTQIIDWGKNNQNVCNIFEYIRRELQNPSAIPGSPSYEPKETYTPPEQPKAESVINFCNKCGARVIKDSNFCVNCGNKLR